MAHLNTPSFPDFMLPEEENDSIWKQTLIDFETTYHLFRNTLQHFKADNLEKLSAKPEQTNYQLIEGGMLHDSYHLGQNI